MWEDVKDGGVFDEANIRVASQRLRIYSGWIVRTIVLNTSTGDVSTNMVFVKDQGHKWNLNETS